MITEQREIKSTNDMINQIARTSCDMGRLGFDYYDYAYLGFNHVKLIFRKEDSHGLRTEGGKLD